MTARRALGWGLLGVTLAGALGAAALLRAPLPPSPPGPEPGRSLYRAHCATCHGARGRGESWRARLLFLRPGDLSSPAAAALPRQYLLDVIRHGGSALGRPGMPSFGFVLSQAEIEAVVDYVRTLPRASGDAARRGGPSGASRDGDAARGGGSG